MKIKLSYIPNEIIKPDKALIGCSVYINDEYFHTYYNKYEALEALLNNRYIEEETYKRLLNKIRMKEIEGDFV